MQYTDIQRETFFRIREIKKNASHLKKVNRTAGKRNGVRNWHEMTGSVSDE
jgi:hypothetical protein